MATNTSGARCSYRVYTDEERWQFLVYAQVFWRVIWAYVRIALLTLGAPVLCVMVGIPDYKLGYREIVFGLLREARFQPPLAE